MRPSEFLGWVLSSWVSAFALLVAFRVLTGKIRLTGLFTVDGKRFSPERLQLFLVFVGALAVYASEALHKGTISPPSDQLLVFLGGSNAVYLSGKIARSL